MTDKHMTRRQMIDHLLWRHGYVHQSGVILQSKDNDQLVHLHGDEHDDEGYRHGHDGLIWNPLHEDAHTS